MEKLGVNLAWLLAQLINFLLILFILRAVAYKPIMNMLETRKKKIQEALEYAEKVKQEAAAQQREFERRFEEQQREFNLRLQSAQQVAEQERQRILAEAQAEAAKIKAEAKGQVEYERRQMLSELRQQVVELSILGAQRVIAASLDDKRARLLVENFLDEMDFGSNGQRAGV